MAYVPRVGFHCWQATAFAEVRVGQIFQEEDLEFYFGTNPVL